MPEKAPAPLKYPTFTEEQNIQDERVTRSAAKDFARQIAEEKERMANQGDAKKTESDSDTK